MLTPTIITRHVAYANVLRYQTIFHAPIALSARLFPCNFQAQEAVVVIGYRYGMDVGVGLAGGEERHDFGSAPLEEVDGCLDVKTQAGARGGREGEFHFLVFGFGWGIGGGHGMVRQGAESVFKEVGRAVEVRIDRFRAFTKRQDVADGLPPPFYHHIGRRSHC